MLIWSALLTTIFHAHRNPLPRGQGSRDKAGSSLSLQVLFAPGFLFQSPVVWGSPISVFCLGILPEDSLYAEHDNGFITMGSL